MTTSNQQIVPVPSTKAAKPESWSQMFVDRARAELAAAPPIELGAYVRLTGSTLGEYTEGGIVGSLLGATHARFGLDSPYGPTDGWLAVLGAALGIALSGHAPALAARARGAGSKAFTVLAFRKAYELVKEEPLLGRVSGGVQRISAPGKGAGVSRPDPIEEAARSLG